VGTNTLTGKSILQIITRLDRGGSADVFISLAKQLAEDGVRGGIIVGRTIDPCENLDSFSDTTGIPVFKVPRLVRNVSPINDCTAFFQIRKIIHRFNPDIVHTHTSKAGIIGRLAAWTVGIRKIVHTPHGHIFYGYYNTILTRLFVLLERIVAKITSRITVLTRKGLEDHIQMKIGYEGLFTVVHSGVDVKCFMKGDGSSVRNETGWQDKFVIGWAGRLTPVKDCATFLDAAAIIRDCCEEARFIVAGDGEQRTMLQRRAHNLDLDGILVFLGNRTDMPSVMAAMDIFVLSSLNEGFGRVIVEAWASKTAIVSTRAGGTVDGIENSISGILVPPSKPNLIAEEVCKLLKNKELRDRLIRSGFERAQFFDTRLMVEKFENIYAKILEI